MRTTPTLLLLGMTTCAGAQPRCDCTSILDSCEASVAVRGGAIEITTDHEHCARVDYLLDGQPFVSLVMEGEARESRPAPAGAPRVLVQSCQVCLRVGAPAGAGGGAAGPVPAGSGAAPPSLLDALIEVRPAYPAAALAMRVEGFVDVEITIAPEGTVESASVLTGEPPGAFDEAALSAVRRWRYPASPDGGLRRLTKRFEFRLGGEPTAPQPAAVERSRDGPRNQCAREASRFNFGSAVEVSLINACPTPVMIYACAKGTGEYRERWACRSSEAERTAVVRPDDLRNGETMLVPADDGQASVTFTDSFLVSRAPNSEYWWLACGTQDLACRAAARQWTRALAGQSARADPRGRSSLPLARSH